MKKKSLGFIFILLSVVIIISNAKITGAIIGNSLSNSLSFIAVILFGVGVFLIITERLENGVVSSRVKTDPLLTRVAEEVGKREAISRDVNHLITELNKGNTNPGIGTKTIFAGVYELRGRNGGRVYYRQIGGDRYEILGYSDKNKTNQRKVINRIKQLYH